MWTAGAVSGVGDTLLLLGEGRSSGVGAWAYSELNAFISSAPGRILPEEEE